MMDFNLNIRAAPAPPDHKEKIMAIDAMEMKLRPPEIPLKPYPPKVITLASGEKMVVREAKREEVGALLGTVFPLIGVPADFYDIVAVRMYSEILGWYRHRVANEFVLVGAIDGVIAGIVTSRHVSGQLGMSLHTMTIKRGLRVGAQLFAAKMEHHIDILGEDEHAAVFVRLEDVDALDLALMAGELALALDRELHRLRVLVRVPKFHVLKIPWAVRGGLSPPRPR